MGISDEEYVRLIANYEAAGYLAQFWPEVGQRDEAAKDLAGVLLRAGWTEDETNGFVCLVAREAGDEEYRRRGKAHTTARKLAAGDEVTGGPSLARRLKGDGARVVAHLYAWLGRPEQRRWYFRSVAPQPSTWLPEPPKVEMGDVEIEPWSVLASNVEEKPVRWLWRGRIPLGAITVLDGDPGLGKSLLALDLAARVTTGREMPDTTPGVDGGVVLLSAEDDLAATVRPRLETAWADLDRVAMMRGVTLYDTTAGATQHQEVLLPRDIRVIERLIWQVRARLVVIDPLMAYLDMKVNSWRDQDVRSALAPLAALAERTGAAILILRHLSKATGTSALYRGGGSIGIVAAARSGLLVAKAPDNPEHERVLAALKSNLGPPLPSLRYRITESVVREGIPMVEWLGECTLTAEQAVAAAQAAPEDAQPSKLEETVDWLHAALVDGPRPGKELERAAHAAGISDATLRRGREQLGVRITRRGYGAEMRAWWSLEEEASVSGTMRAESGDASSPVVFNSTSPVHPEIMSGTDTDEHD